MELTRKDIRSNVAHNVKWLRKFLGLTQYDLSVKINVKRCTIGAVEEERALDVPLLLKLSEYTGYSINQLITEKFN